MTEFGLKGFAIQLNPRQDLKENHGSVNGSRRRDDDPDISDGNTSNSETTFLESVKARVMAPGRVKDQVLPCFKTSQNPQS